MKNLIYKLFKYLVNPGEINKNLEYRRLKKLNPYTPTETEFHGKKLKLVDAPTFLNGWYEIFSKKIYEFKSDRENPYIIDCGANIGLSVIYFKELYPKSTLIAFEPDPQIFQTLSFNVKSFEFKNVELHQKAIWKEDTEMTFLSEGSFSGRISKEDDKGKLVKVQACKLSGFIDKEVDFLKIDIEGAEFEVIKEIKNQLPLVKNIFIEYHSHAKERQTLQELLSILADSGYRYHIQEAFARNKPFVDTNTILNMDLQLNIFGYREER